MFNGKLFGEKFRSGALLLSLLVFTSQCSREQKQAATALPTDIFGISVGMSADEAKRRAGEIGQFQREEINRQQIWSVARDASYAYLIIALDEANKVRYVSALAKPKGGAPVFYKTVGDTSAARAEVAGANHKYIWKARAGKSLSFEETATEEDEEEEKRENGGGEYYVIAEGKNAEFLSILTLAESLKNGESEEEQERERQERSK
jgi:hypothetical protein